MYLIPLTTSPIGWVILGIGGYALYRAGKKRGADKAAASQITEITEPLPQKKKTDKAKGDK